MHGSCYIVSRPGQFWHELWSLGSCHVHTIPCLRKVPARHVFVRPTRIVTMRGLHEIFSKVENAVLQAEIFRYFSCPGYPLINGGTLSHKVRHYFFRYFQLLVITCPISLPPSPYLCSKLSKTKKNRKVPCVRFPVLVVH